MPAPDTTDRGAATDALMVVSKIVTAAVAHTLAEVEPAVTVTQLRVLVILHSRGPMNLSGVADGLGVNPSNASRTCDKLVTAGMLERRDLEHDRRNLVLSLTRAGQALVDSLMQERRAIFDGVVARMEPADQRRLAQSLQAFVAAVEAAPEDQRIPQAGSRLIPWLV